MEEEALLDSPRVNLLSPRRERHMPIQNSSVQKRREEREKGASALEREGDRQEFACTGESETEKSVLE